MKLYENKYLKNKRIVIWYNCKYVNVSTILLRQLDKALLFCSSCYCRQDTDVIGTHYQSVICFSPLELALQIFRGLLSALHFKERCCIFMWCLLLSSNLLLSLVSNKMEGHLMHYKQTGNVLFIMLFVSTEYLIIGDIARSDSLLWGFVVVYM